ncbi:MAG TPA: redoxin domain-containing protein [Acidobacteriaceae bacterium]|nr:redoxin domain-containing protein [Acidobacteriaceae bacterium]
MQRIGSVLLAGTMALGSIAAWALPHSSMAPEFKGTDSNGVTHTLSQYRGKYVVLEWANRGCPYEQKHYLSGNMEQLQRQWTAKGVVWLSIISSAPGEQGYVTASEENEYLKQMKAAPTAALLDPAGTIGHLYDARTTPHIFVIDPAGKIIYQGALDNQPTPDPASLKIADNYLNDALNAAMAGKQIPIQVTKPYGCSVKYAR